METTQSSPAVMRVLESAKVRVEIWPMWRFSKRPAGWEEVSLLRRHERCWWVYLSVVAEKETYAVVSVAPFQELVVVRWEVEAERRCTEQTVELWHINQRRHPFAALCGLESASISTARNRERRHT